MDRMERRFGARELLETSYARFASAQQRENEELEDWADRVLTLANRAFKDLPESHMNRQAIIKLCQGCADREAGQNACNARPTSMQGGHGDNPLVPAHISKYVRFQRKQG